MLIYMSNQAVFLIYKSKIYADGYVHAVCLFWSICLSYMLILILNCMHTLLYEFMLVCMSKICLCSLFLRVTSMQGAQLRFLGPLFKFYSCPLCLFAVECVGPKYCPNPPYGTPTLCWSICLNHIYMFLNYMSILVYMSTLMCILVYMFKLYVYSGLCLNYVYACLCF